MRNSDDGIKVTKAGPKRPLLIIAASLTAIFGLLAVIYQTDWLQVRPVTSSAVAMSLAADNAVENSAER